MHEPGFHLESKSDESLSNQSADKIEEAVIKRILEYTEDGKLRVKGGGKFVSLHEIGFQTLLCEFYDLCNKNKHHYTENNFIRVMEINGFRIPQFSYTAFDTLKKIEASTQCITPQNLYNVRDLLDDIRDSTYILARRYWCKNDEDYYLAVVLELVRQGHLVKQCEHCGRWFVTEKKTDEKYCKRESPTHTGKTCQQAMRLIRDTQRINADPIKKAKAAARSRAHSQENHNHVVSVAQCKDLIRALDGEYKNGKLSESDYILRLNNAFRRKMH